MVLIHYTLRIRCVYVFGVLQYIHTQFKNPAGINNAVSIGVFVLFLCHCFVFEDAFVLSRRLASIN